MLWMGVPPSAIASITSGDVYLVHGSQAHKPTFGHQPATETFPPPERPNTERPAARYAAIPFSHSPTPAPTTATVLLQPRFGPISTELPREKPKLFTQMCTTVSTETRFQLDLSKTYRYLLMNLSRSASAHKSDV